MASIAFPPPDLQRIDPAAEPSAAWDLVVSAATRWGDARGVDWRDAVVLLPFAQLLPPARQAWARRGGWMPRIETTRTLAASLAPPSLPLPGALTFDTPTDRLSAARLLRGSAWARAWHAQDARRFDHAVTAMVELAQAFARAAAAVPPDEREAHWAACRRQLAPGDDPARRERAIASIALAWAADASLSTDVLFALAPSAWVCVKAGGAEPMADALLARASGPRLVVDCDVPADAPFKAPRHTRIAAGAVDGFEAEAQRAAACVIDCLGEGLGPVALVAQDRSLVRRVRALLERGGIPIADETGWRLSTTRAAARVMAWLRATRTQPASDDVLDWLKASPHDGPGLRERAAGTLALETSMRLKGWARWSAIDIAQLGGEAARVHGDVQALRERFAAPRVRSLVQWLSALRATLEASGDLAVLSRDHAGQQLTRALHLDEAWHGEAGSWSGMAGAVDMTLDEFIGWVDDVLEDATFTPEGDARAPVVITPLARAMLRPFGAVVFPGADARRLGGGAKPWPLIGDATARALGLDDAAVRRERQLLAFAQLLRVSRVFLLHRRVEGEEPLGASPFVERLSLARAAAGVPVEPLDDPRTAVAVDARPTRPPAPTAAELLPSRLSATAVEMLRACPYRFFALSVLGLRESDELDDAVEKRDYGSWLHAVLHRFHEDCDRSGWPDDPAAALRRTARAQREALGLDEAEFVPYAASFARFVPRYLAWLRKRDEEGASWSAGEQGVSARPEELRGIELHGRIDRIDRVNRDSGTAVQLIDYKTGSAEALRRQLRDTTEDTQLAFYAALMTMQDDAPHGPVEAAYLALDGSKRIEFLEHEGVERSAAMLVEQLGVELERIRRGAALPALGAGVACDFCAARGLCRRDDWAQPA